MGVTEKVTDMKVISCFICLGIRRHQLMLVFIPTEVPRSYLIGGNILLLDLGYHAGKSLCQHCQFRLVHEKLD